MSEEKQHRSPQDIQNEYSQVCAQMGDIQVKTEGLTKATQERMVRVAQLNQESLESQAYYERLQKELEEKKNEAPQS